MLTVIGLVPTMVDMAKLSDVLVLDREDEIGGDWS